MGTAQSMDSDQATLWNGPAGRAWVEAQHLLDRLFRPFEEMLAEAVAAEGAARVLDVGCGTGATTLAAARRLPPGGRCTGVDISAPMVAVAKERAEREGAPASFIVGDAQTHPFASGAFDMIISRFGIMFFADPVAAFANLRRAAGRGAALRIIPWRSAAENPFMTAAERAAAPCLPDLPPRKAGGPGQFAFADPALARNILERSGWRDIDIQPLDVACALPEADLMDYLARLGPVGMALQDADEGTRGRVIEAVRAAFEPYVRDGVARFTAACWTVSARA